MKQVLFKKLVKTSLLVAFLLLQELGFCQVQLTLGDNPGEIQTAGLYACVPCGLDSKNYEWHPDFLATTWTKNGNYSVGRSLIRFDLSQIPANATILSAKLNLYHYDSPYNSGHSQLSGTNPAKLFMVTQAWNASTVTWNNKPTAQAANAISLPATANNSVDVLNIDLLKQVALWYSKTMANNGLLFQLDTEVQYRAMLFGSAENPDPNVRPKLIITYEVEVPNPLVSLIIRIPNVFTPNSDGTSDVFEVSVKHYSSYRIQIYNRWGSLVYESDNASLPWNGTFRNNEVAEGVYFALISVTDLFGISHEFNTTVHLFR